MWKLFRLRIEEWVPQCRIVYDKFHILQHANDAVEEVRRAEFPQRGADARSDQRERWLFADPVEEPRTKPARYPQPAVPVEQLNKASLRLICSKKVWNDCGTTGIRERWSTICAGGSISCGGSACPRSANWPAC